MHPASITSPRSISLRGTAIPGAADRQRLIHGFDQERLSRAHVLCVGAGGIVSQIAPTLVRKGVGRLTVVDHDIVQESNLNRQRFYRKDVGRHKALALAENLLPECTAETLIEGIPLRFEEAVATGLELACNVAICGVDNNPARAAAARFFAARNTPVVFTAVSRDAGHGYVLVQEPGGPCIACLFPDIVNDDSYPCPGTPAIADILQTMGALVVYVVDTLLMARRRVWNYRTLSLADGSLDACSRIPVRSECPICAVGADAHRRPAKPGGTPLA